MHGNVQLIEYMIIGSIAFAGIVAVGICYGIYRLLKRKKS